MSFGSFCLHVALCFGLLVNGSAHAMSAQHRTPSRDAPIAAPSSHHSAQVSATREMGVMHAGSTKGHPGCCKVAACTCACPAGMVAALPSVADRRGHWLVSPSGLQPSLYVSPTPERLIRPPIV
ncbi:MAG: CopL family metal-binding regulatory protein [Burkholderiales bacterium]|nr:CopL family metal-binding regulatory protein [Burkholderiales bacterium]